MTSPRRQRKPRRPRWRCRIKGCRQGGQYDPGVDGWTLFLEHYLAEHFEPTEAVS